MSSVGETKMKAVVKLQKQVVKYSATLVQDKKFTQQIVSEIGESIARVCGPCDGEAGMCSGEDESVYHQALIKNMKGVSRDEDGACCGGPDKIAYKGPAVKVSAGAASGAAERGFLTLTLGLDEAGKCDPGKTSNGSRWARELSEEFTQRLATQRSACFRTLREVGMAVVTCQSSFVASTKAEKSAAQRTQAAIVGANQQQKMQQNSMRMQGQNNQMQQMNMVGQMQVQQMAGGMQPMSAPANMMQNAPNQLHFTGVESMGVNHDLIALQADTADDTADGIESLKELSETFEELKELEASSSTEVGKLCVAAVQSFIPSDESSNTYYCSELVNKYFHELGGGLTFTGCEQGCLMQTVAEVMEASEYINTSVHEAGRASAEEKKCWQDIRKRFRKALSAGGASIERVLGQYLRVETAMIQLEKELHAWLEAYMDENKLAQAQIKTDQKEAHHMTGM